MITWAELLSRVPVAALLFATVATAATLVFAPVERFGVRLDLEDARFWVAVVGLGAVWLLVAQGVGAVATWLLGWWQSRSRDLERFRRLETLAGAEREVLQPFVAQNRRVVHLPADSATVLALEAEKIIRRDWSPTASWASYGPVPYQIADWAWLYLNAHPELVGLRSGELAEARFEDAKIYFDEDEEGP